MTSDFYESLQDHLAEPTAMNGVQWPKDPLEKWILGWLEMKANHSYTWPRWAAAEEVREAVYSYFENVWERPELES